MVNEFVFQNYAFIGPAAVAQCPAVLDAIWPPRFGSQVDLTNTGHANCGLEF